VVEAVGEFDEALAEILEPAVALRSVDNDNAGTLGCTLMEHRAERGRHGRKG